MPVFYENSNIEEGDKWIRLWNKLRWLKMQVMLTFFAMTIWNIHLQTFWVFSLHFNYVVRFEWYIVLSSSYDGWNKHGYTICDVSKKVLLLF